MTVTLKKKTLSNHRRLDGFWECQSLSHTRRGSAIFTKLKMGNSERFRVLTLGSYETVTSFRFMFTEKFLTLKLHGQVENLLPSEKMHSHKNSFRKDVITNLPFLAVVTLCFVVLTDPVLLTRILLSLCCFVYSLFFFIYEKIWFISLLIPRNHQTLPGRVIQALQLLQEPSGMQKKKNSWPPRWSVMQLLLGLHMPTLWATAAFKVSVILLLTHCCHR